jgi:hypothetical protein
MFNECKEDIKMKVYKIRNKETGLFATGGTDCKFNKTGKVWKTLAHVKTHLKQYIVNNFDRDYRASYVEKCDKYIDSIEIVEYECVKHKIIDICECFKSYEESKHTS